MYFNKIRSARVVALLAVALPYGMYVFLYLDALKTTWSGEALTKEQRWAVPYLDDVRLHIILPVIASIGVLLLIWTLFEIKWYMHHRARGISMNKMIKDMLRFSITNDQLLEQTAAAEIIITDRECKISKDVFKYASTEWLAKLLLALLNANAEGIMGVLGHNGIYRNATYNVFHQLTSDLSQFLYPNDVAKIIQFIRQEKEFLGVALENAVQYMEFERRITELRDEQAQYVMNYGTTIDEFIGRINPEPDRPAITDRLGQTLRDTTSWVLARIPQLTPRVVKQAFVRRAA